MKDIGILWQQQPVENDSMSLKLLQMRAQQLAEMTQREFYKHCGLALVLLAFNAGNLMVSSRPWQQLGFAVMTAWAMYAFINVRQNIHPSSLSHEALFETCLAFSLDALQRSLKYSRRSGLIEGGLIIFTFGVFIAPFVSQILTKPATLQKCAPVLCSLLIWMLLFGVMQVRKTQRLRRELKELSDLGLSTT